MNIRSPRITFALAAFLTALLASSQVVAQEQRVDDRIRALEEQVSDLRAELEQLQRIVRNDKLVAGLDGLWTQKTCTRRGIAVHEAEDVIWQLTPRHAYQWILSPEPPKWTLGAMDVDATHDPAWVNFRRDRFGDGVKVIPGIIAIQNGMVLLALREDVKCDPHPDNEYIERPTSFASTAENGVTVFVLERQAPN